MHKSIRYLYSISKRHLPKEMHRKLKLIRKTDEFGETARYAIARFLENAHLSLEEKAQRLENEKKDVFFLKNKLIIIPSKIKIFAVFGTEEEFYKAFNLIKEVKKEIEILDV